MKIIKKESKEELTKIYNKLQDKWINVWKEDNCYLAKKHNAINNDGSFDQCISQSPFETYCGYPDYVTDEDGYWAPTLQEFINYMDNEEWICSKCNEEYDNNVRRTSKEDKFICEYCDDYYVFSIR